MRLLSVLALAAALASAGCVNPNDIGVQVYGSVNAHVQTASGQAVNGALVSIGSTYTQNSDASGNATFPQIPVGSWVVKADSPGLEGCTPVNVTQNNASSVIVTVSSSTNCT